MIEQIVSITSKRVQMRFHMLYGEHIEDIPTYDVMEDKAMTGYTGRFPEVQYELGDGHYTLSNPSPLQDNSWGFVRFELEFEPIKPSCKDNAPSQP